MKRAACLSLAWLLIALQLAQAAISDSKDSSKASQLPVDRDRLRHFLGLRAHPHHKVVYQSLPALHHGLHMLNHQVGPLQRKMLQPFGKGRRTRFINGTRLNIQASGEPKKGWDAIKLMRGETCVQMLKEHGIDFTGNKDDCVVFMDKNCKSASGKAKPICAEWYSLKDGHEAHAVGASPAAAPYGAPSPSGPPDGVQELEMKDTNEKLQEQGFTGKLVRHNNMVTQTSDWHTEYGPNGPPHSYEAICAEYPNNMWCKLRGYHKKTSQDKLKAAEKSSASHGHMQLTSYIAAAILLSICM